MPWGHTRLWTNSPGAPSHGFNGSGVVVAQLPYLLAANGTSVLAAVTTGTNARYFDLVNNAYQGRFFVQDTLTFDGAAGEYVLTDTAGDRLRFFGFANTLPVNQRGQFKSLTDPYGNLTSVVSRNANGLPLEVQHSSAVAGTTVTESYLYTYLSNGVDFGLLSSVALRRQTNGGAWTTVRQAVYTYYDGVEPYGNLGDLKTAAVLDGAGATLGTWYYRYYTPGEANGYVHGLKYAVSPPSYDRLVAALGSNLAAIGDAQLALYADYYFRYDDQQRVTRVDLPGAGASAAGGLGTYIYAYTTSSNTDGYNNWKGKTVETLPDGNQTIAYTNAYGEVMLYAFHETASGREWLAFTQFDDHGRVLLTAGPSAVTGYSEAYADLLNSQGSNYQYLSDSAGLVAAATYATATTATATTPGDVAGFLQGTSLRRGETGTAVPQGSGQYISRTVGSTTVYAVAAETAYRNADGTGPETTSYSFTWQGTALGPASMTVTFPLVGTFENGPGTAEADTTFFDGYGRPVWGKDADGFLFTVAYDQASGAAVRAIADVDTTRTGDFTNLPSGWSTPSGGGLHLLTQLEVDALGRATKLTEPNGHVAYRVFNDPTHEVRVYAGWNSSSNTPTGPTAVLREDWANGYAEALTMTATPTVSGGRPTGAEAISGVQTLARSYTDLAGQVTAEDAYFNLAGLTYSTSPTLGTENTNFYRTRLDYDNRGRLNRAVSPTGTIYRTAYDSLSRPVSASVGTNDTGSPNMVQVGSYVYDGGGIGDGNLTQATASPGGGAADRVTQLYYDWRNRAVAVKEGVEGTESTSLNRAIGYAEYDNLGEVVAAEQYDGDGVSITTVNGVPAKPSASLLRARGTAEYDEQGRVYRSHTYSVDQSNGTVSTNSLTGNVWYGHRGQVLATAAPGGLVSKAKFDGAGRVTAEYVSDGGADTAWADAGNVTGDVVLEQAETVYDANSNPILVTARQRFHDETATGALGSATTAPKARVSYGAAYYDLADRLTDSVDIGTNGGTAWTRPSSAPARSDTVLVASYGYNSAGWLESVTDPRGIVGKTFYDNLGQVTKTVEDYVDGTPSAADDKTTEFTYDGSGNLLTLTARLPGSAYQTTQYLYGVSTATGSSVNSNDLLSAVRHPDKTTGSASASEQETVTVNALGETRTATDRNGNVHSYGYDVLGRLTSDAVTTLGSGVDGAVRRLEVAYDTGGRPYLFTSYDAASAGNVVNQVQDGFNGLGQLTAEYQAHSGTVNTGATPKVQYAYTEMAGGANHSRPVSLTYPNGRVVNYNYATGLDDRISRLTSLSDNTATLESYAYLGLGTVVRRAHPQPGVDLSYIKQTGESNGDAGDQYTGLDRFGRVDDQRWIKASDGTARDRYQYGYDRDSNRLYRSNVVNGAFSELYSYDGLNQLTSFQRGTLSDSNSDGVPDTVASPTRSQSWSLDAMGNWSSVTTDGTTQTRSHNAQNEITGIGGSSLTFDANGNLTTDETGKQYVYDAWNRLVKVKASGGSTLATYRYDALGRRIVETVGGTTRDLYYSADWQVLEERVGGQAQAQCVWSPVYVDALVERDRDADGNSANGLEERLYALQDANWNVTALVDASGNVVERYAYDAFGQGVILAGDWSSRTGSAYAWVYLHQGGRFEVTTGLYHFRAREYSPSLGRWVQVDPIGFHGGDTNLYRAIGNNTPNSTDPTGEVVLVIVGVGLGIIAVVYVFGPTVAELAYRDPKLEEQVQESRDRILAMEKRVEERVPREGADQLQSRFDTGLINRGDWNDGIEKATVLATGGIFWAASGPSWVTPRGTFLLRGNKWTNSSGECLAGEEEAAANAAFTRTTSKIRALPGARATTQTTGTNLAARAKHLYKPLTSVEKDATTIGVTRVKINGQWKEVVSVNGGARPSAVKAIKKAVEREGAIFEQAPGREHPDAFLHKKYGNAEGFEAIGISHAGGPCDTCKSYFNGEGFADVYWDSTRIP